MAAYQRRLIMSSDYRAFIEDLTDRDCMDLASAIQEGFASCSLDGSYSVNDRLTVTRAGDDLFTVRDSKTGYAVRYTASSSNSFFALLRAKERKQNNGRLLEDVLRERASGHPRKD